MPLTPDALAGFRVLDLTTVIMGPFATATLADLARTCSRSRTSTGT